jgi:hypothetical protein
MKDNGIMIKLTV